MSCECCHCGAPLAGALHGANVACRFCKQPTLIPGGAAVGSQSRGGGPLGERLDRAPLPSRGQDPCLPSRGQDPLHALVSKGCFGSIREGHRLVPFGSRRRLLDWEPASGSYRLWAVDGSAPDPCRKRSHMDGGSRLAPVTSSSGWGATDFSIGSQTPARTASGRSPPAPAASTTFFRPFAARGPGRPFGATERSSCSTRRRCSTGSPRLVRFASGTSITMRAVAIRCRGARWQKAPGPVFDRDIG